MKENLPLLGKNFSCHLSLCTKIDYFHLNRFTNHFHNDYRNVAVGGFNVWEPNPHCVVFDSAKNQNKTCNGIDAAEGCTLKFMSYEASLYGSGHGANWHPSQAFHLLRGEFIAWIYGLILYDAIAMVELDLQSSSLPDLLRSKFFYTNETIFSDGGDF